MEPVVVIGGGVAGLAAFQSLRRAEVDAVLLEARERLGGRVHTLHPDGWPLPVELGAEFIHGFTPELRELAVPAVGHRRDWSSLENRLLPAGEFAGGAEAVFARMARILPPRPDRSFARFLEENPDLPAAAREGATAYVEGFEAADPRRISVYSLNREHAEEEAEEAAPDNGPRRPCGGYSRLLDRLAAPGRIVCQAQVEAVVWRADGATVTAATPEGRRRWLARRVIVTLPLSLLQQGSVRFDPPLEAKREPLDQLVMGAALRVTLRLRRPIWEEARDDQGTSLAPLGFLFGRPPETGHFPVWWTTPDSDEGAAQITGWAAGRHAWALAGMPEEGLRQRAFADLTGLLRLGPGRLEEALVACHVHDWQSDPFSRGGYSYAGVGGVDAPVALAAPLAQTLFFAGEACAGRGDYGTVHGALRTGREAAAAVLALG